MSLEGTLFILVGPSAAGKNTLMKLVQDQLGDLPQLATATTREKRDDEVEGREHHFVTRDEFQRLIDTGALFEYQPVHMGDLYGTPRQTVEDALRAGLDLIADIDFLGASKIYEAYPDHTVLIFVSPSRLDTLTERIRQRGKISPAAAADRLERAKFEMTFAPKCHYLILNDILAPAVEHLRQIIVSERIRRRGGVSGSPAMLEKPVFHSAVIGLIQRADHMLMRTNSISDELPTFPVTDHTRLPHETLKQAIQETLGYRVSIEAVSDKRFDFIAPLYVTMAAIPHDVYLYYYYRCGQPPPELIQPAGWVWRPVVELNLPSAIKKLVTW
jgi:guanylate kinase